MRNLRFHSMPGHGQPQLTKRETNKECQPNSESDIPDYLIATMSPRTNLTLDHLLTFPETARKCKILQVPWSSQSRSNSQPYPQYSTATFYRILPSIHSSPPSIIVHKHILNNTIMSSQCNRCSLKTNKWRMNIKINQKKKGNAWTSHYKCDVRNVYYIFQDV